MSAFYLDIMGFDLEAEIDYKVTYWGCDAQISGPPERCYPGEAPEWEIRHIWLSRDEGRNVKTPEWEATGKLFDLLCDHFSDEIAERIAEEGPDDDRYW